MKKNQIKFTGGLRKTTTDNRDFKLGSIFGLPGLSELPPTFEYEVPEIRNQGDTDFCSAFSTCYASEIQEGNNIEPSYSFALSKLISGDVNGWGQDIRSALKAHVKYGALCKQDSPYSLENKDAQFLRDIKNWPNLFDKAKINQKQSFFKVTGQYDHFDNIRASMWKFKDDKRAVVFGSVWSWPITQTFMDKYGTDGFGHMMCITGWNDKGLIITNSIGQSNPKQTFTREVINQAVDEYGAYMFIDIPHNKAQNMIKFGITEEDGWFKAVLKTLATYLWK